MSIFPKANTSLSVLYNRELTFFLLARVSNIVAYQILSVAVGWQIYALTGSAFSLGLIGLAQFLPLFLLTLIAGQAADRYNRRVITYICQFLQGVGGLALALGTFSGWVSEGKLIGIIFLLGAVRAFDRPTMQALMPALVPAEIFPQAVAVASSLTQAATIIGPAMGGLLYIYGASFAYLLVSVLFILAGILVVFLGFRQTSAKSQPVSMSSLFAGIHFIRSNQAVLGAISLDLFAVLLGGATAMLPIYAKEILSIGPAGLGMLRSAPAVGAVVMSAYLAHRPLKRRVGKVMFYAVIVFGFATMVFALSTSFWISLAALIILGAADVISVVIRSSLVQLKTPDEMRGRVSAVNSMFIGTSNQLGEFESGITAAWFGVVPAVFLGGIGTICVVLAWMKLFPELVQVDSLE
ncbi:MAG: protein of unknown function DitE [Firmicutes bacterium]|nr:protein of unknown function DitE [Bacillota bacterium]